MVEITIGPEGTGRGGGVCENLARGTPSGAVVASWYVTDPPPLGEWYRRNGGSRTGGPLEKFNRGPPYGAVSAP